jgi:hypothetical protein
MSNYHFCDSNEKLVTEVRNAALKAALKKGRNIILDETNLNPRNFEEVTKIVKELNISAMIMEKPFYIELEEALERDSKRIGTAKVGEEIVRKFWKKSGGKQHKFYKPKAEIFQPGDVDEIILCPDFDLALPNAIISDLDGTLALFNSIGKNGQAVLKHKGVHVRSPYDASKCEADAPNEPVVAVIDSFYKNGYKIIFCSGREDCYRTQTEKFITKHLGIEYELFMRQTADQRKDSIIKQEIYNKNIKGKYNVFFVLDDRDQVVELWRSLGLTCFQVAEGNF